MLRVGFLGVATLSGIYIHNSKRKEIKKLDKLCPIKIIKKYKNDKEKK